MKNEEKKIKISHLIDEIEEMDFRLGKYMNCEVQEELLVGIKNSIKEKRKELEKLLKE